MTVPEKEILDKLKSGLESFIAIRANKYKLSVDMYEWETIITLRYIPFDEKQSFDKNPRFIGSIKDSWVLRFRFKNNSVHTAINAFETSSTQAEFLESIHDGEFDLPQFIIDWLRTVI